MPKRGNGEGSIYPYKNKAGKVIGYRGCYWIHTTEGPKRRYISGKKREDVRDKLAKALSDRANRLVFDAGALTVGEYLDRWLDDVRDKGAQEHPRGVRVRRRAPHQARSRADQAQGSQPSSDPLVLPGPPGLRRRSTSNTSPCTRP
jgi:hypothetical protein